MSRGFVKEDDQEEVPFVPPRADLPEGTPNYVTETGMKLLLEERTRLNEEKDSLAQETEKDRRIAGNIIDLKLKLLNERIATARVLKNSDKPNDQVYFGAEVTLKVGGSSASQVFRIVGVDEADIKKGKIAFTSPLAKLLVHKKKGEVVQLKLPAGERTFEILDINY